MKVNEIFYSLQGEGHYTGTPAVFVRFAGCNLRCWFCDTDFEKGDEMSEDEIVEAVLQYPTRYVVITGGEPTLQITASLCDKLHAHGLYLIRLRHIDELKVVFEDSPTQDMALYEQIPATEYRLQPCDTQDPLCNQAILNKTIKYILQHPKWKLSLQTHKILHVR